MVSKVAWSRQEAAILLESYIEFLNGKLSRSQSIKRVSDGLRKMAVNSGIQIDDIFRNENGIFFQMQSMESAYRGVTVMKPATRLFTEVVTLYNNNREEYKKLLKEAKAVIDKKANYEELFSSWAATAAPSIPNDILFGSLITIEQFCLKLEVLKAPLFETTDLNILKSVQKTVSQNKIFRILNKKRLKWIDASMTCFLKFIKDSGINSSALTTVQHTSSPFQSQPHTKVEEPLASTEDIIVEPYVRTEHDKRLLVKYPLIYKQIFSALYECKKNITIAELYDRINHIARCADIEDILDNVSWSKCEHNYYAFSEEPVLYNKQINVIDNKAPTVSIPEPAEIKTNVVNFNYVGNYSYTKPVNFSYFGDKTAGLTSWTDLYVKLVSMLYSDFPNAIPISRSFTGSDRVDFGNKDDAETMKAPKPICTQMYLETNLSASDIIGKIKTLLDICRVNYGNVVIEYQQKIDILPTSSAITCGRKDSQEFAMFLRNHEGMANATCRSYVSAIGIAERFAGEHRFEHRRLFTPDRHEAKATIDALLCDPEFIRYNNQQHNRFRAAMKKLLIFIRTDSMPIASLSSQSVADKKYREVLIINFRKGFRMGSPIELRKFRLCYEQAYNKPLDDNDALIERNIALCGIRFGDKVFVPQTMLGDVTRDRLFAYIRKSFDEGKTALYYQALFNEFSEDFLDYFIYNADMLKEYLSYFLGDDYFFGRSYMSKGANTTVDPVDELRTCLKEYARPMTYDMLFEKLPHIPQQKIKQMLAANNEFVSNGRGEYFHIYAVHLSDEELDNIAEIITAAIDDKEFLSGNELINAIKSKYPYIYEKNNDFSMVGLRDAIKYHLDRRFSFSGNIISKSGSNLTMTDVFADYCRSRDSFTLNELNVLAGELGTVIYFDPVYENSLRINHDRFVSKSRANFSISETDAVLDLFCTGNYTSVGKINEFSLFPNAGFPWNEYLLEHYVAEYSKHYFLLHTGFNANKCAGAVVKKSTGLESFDDCIVTVLSDSGITLKKQQALQYLCDEGYIARRNLSNIEELLIKAAAQRNRKEAN